MEPMRQKVVAAYDPRGSLIWSAIVGSVFVMPEVILRSIPDAGMILSPLLVLSGLARACFPMWLAILAALGWWFARHCQRRAHVFKVGIAFSVGWMLAMLLPGILNSPMALWGWSDAIGLALLIAFGLVVCVLFGLGNLFVNFVFRQVRYVVVEQDGTRCWTCAYIVGNPPTSERCSECGAPTGTINDARRKNRLVRGAKHHARVIAILLAFALAALIVPQIWRQTESTRRLANALSPNARVIGCAMLRVDTTGPAPRWSGGWDGQGIWFPAPGDSTKAINVVYEPQPKSGQPNMQVQLMGLTPQPFGGPLPSFGNPAITCDLSPTQTQHVLTHGLPQSLIDTLLDTAQKAKWAPMPGGGAVTAMTVDAGPHFPTQPN